MSLEEAGVSPSGAANDPIHRAIAGELEAAVTGALAGLSTVQQAIVELSGLGHGAAEIGLIWRSPPATHEFNFIVPVMRWPWHCGLIWKEVPDE